MMRPWAGLLLTTAAAICASEALAQPGATPAAKQALLDAVFISPPHKLANHPSQFSTTTLGVRGETRTVMSAGGVFVLPAVTGTSLDQTHLLSPAQIVGGKGLVVWRTNETSFGSPSGAVDTLRMSVGGVARGPSGVVLASPGALLDPDAEAFDVSYTRGWPAVWKVSMGDYALDVTPHAGVGANSVGPTAEAGATLRVGASAEDRVMRRLGLHVVDAAPLDDRGRWFLFASASGRAVGLSMAPAGQTGVQRADWSSEAQSAMISDAQAGLGWRRGDVQASFGYVHRAVKSETQMASGPQPASYHDSMVAFSFSFTGR